MTFKKALAIVVISAVGLLLLGCVLPADLLFHVAAGWAMFLWRVIPEISLSRDGVLTAAFCLVGLSAGLHLFLGWLYREMYRQPGKSEDAGNGVSPAPSSTDRALRRWPVRWTGILLDLLVLMFIAGISAVGMTHQMTWLVRAPEPLVESSMREAVARIRSMNNMHQIAIAAHAHHDTYGNFPAGGLFDAQGRALHGWQTSLLPFVEEKDLFQQINLGIPWTDPVNAPHFRTKVNVYLSPYSGLPEEDRGFALSHYAGNARLLGGDVPWSIERIADGTANTLLMGEAAGNYKPWGHPTNWRDPALGINQTPDGFGSPLSGATFAMADASVRFLSEKIDPQVLKALSTPAGGEPTPDF
jgi:Protein of unknown function (DUF1559)